MKKTILRILTSVFLATSITMSVLYIIKNKSHDNMTEFWINMIDAFSNWVSYALCAEDVFLWNIEQRSCDRYSEQYLEDTEDLIDVFDMEIDYDYIGE
jgi:type I restriction-modification system DNA methylase subunit